MSFTQFNLDPAITKAITACGYTKPTPIQLQSIPKILEGHDIVACAQTGTGKTAAFVLPALELIRKPSPTKKARILILTPTRELANQVMEACTRYGKFLRFNTACLVGGMSYRQQLKELSRNVDLIVATPGRLLDHLDKGHVNLGGIEMLVLDEADRMLDMGFIDDVTAIAELTPKHKQTLLFSATVDGKLNQVIKKLLRHPIHVDLSREKMAPIEIKQELYMVDNLAHKNKLLEHLLANEKMFKTIIFCSTKRGADQLAHQLMKDGYLALPLHGDLKQSVRNKTIEKLRKNKIQCVVATDVAARGIDISDLTHVINYDLPHFHEDYVHRIGRTGRAGKTGKAISFASHLDKRHVERIERYTHQTLERKIIEGLEPTIKASHKAAKHDKPYKSFKRKRNVSGSVSAQIKYSASNKKFKRDFKRDFKKDFKSDSKRDVKPDTQKEFQKDFKPDYKKKFKKDFRKDFKKDFKSDTKTADTQKDSQKDFKKKFRKDFKKDFKSDFKSDSKKEFKREKFKDEERKNPSIHRSEKKKHRSHSRNKND